MCKECTKRDRDIGKLRQHIALLELFSTVDTPEVSEENLELLNELSKKLQIDIRIINGHLNQIRTIKKL